jgi:glycosyltransferase involved in cell wall biosynthesis
VDVIIQAFNKNCLPLIIIGSGKLEKKLKKLAHDNITFTGYLPTDKYIKILAYVKAFVHVSPDDPLPMAPLEAMSMGIPVIGYYGAGLKEIIIEGKTGVFFHNLTPESLNEAILKFQTLSFNKHICQLHAKQFSKEQFLNKFPNMVLSAYEKYQKTQYRNRP